MRGHIACMALGTHCAGLSQHAVAATSEVDVRCGTPYTEELPGCREVTVSPEEIAHFKTHGFLVKRGLIAAAALGAVRDYVWDCAPPCLTRAPHTWRSAPTLWPDPDEERVGRLAADGVWKLRSRGKVIGRRGGVTVRDGIGTEPWLLGVTVNHEAVRAVAKHLVGGRLRESYRVRGIYNVFPPESLPDATIKPGGGHTDGHAGQLGGMVLVRHQRSCTFIL